ncbi:MAG: hypothetical protein KC448_14215 [Yoonia sp.]|nr:hypothetical protein [Yoonia sp.]
MRIYAPVATAERYRTSGNLRRIINQRRALATLRTNIGLLIQVADTLLNAGEPGTEQIKAVLIDMLCLNIIGFPLSSKPGIFPPLVLLIWRSSRAVVRHSGLWCSLQRTATSSPRQKFLHRG